MSSNLVIYGKRKIHVIGINKIEEQIKEIEIWQVPTKATQEIIASYNPLHSYFEWTMEASPDYAKKHISRLREEVKTLKREGYKIFFETT